MERQDMFEDLDKLIFKVCEEEGYSLDEVFDLPSDNETNVIMAEEELGVVFPADYRYFLIKYGSGGFGYFDFMGVERSREVKSFTVVLLTLKYRSNGLKNNYVAIEYNGDYITCIDCDDGKIITWSWLEKDRITCAGNSFEDYFTGKLNDCL